MANSEDYSANSLIYNILPDTIVPLVENRPMLLYCYGHYGYSWSLVTKIEKEFRVFSGRVNYIGEQILRENTISNKNDSIKFFSANEDLLSWGFDSIAIESSKMKPDKGKHFVTVYESLYVIDSMGKCVFDSDNAQQFLGPDSVEFNKKFHKLSLIMWWLSDSSIRKYIPDSAIF